MFKKLLLVGCAVTAGLVVLTVAIVVAVFFFTGGIVETADAFFQQVAEGNMDEAWTHLSADFKESTPRDELEAFLEDSSLAEYESASWNNRRVTPDTGTLEGTVKTPEGRIPITISFVKEDDGWKIQSIEKEPTGIAQSAEVSVPTLEESAALVKATTQEFAAAINNEDFSEFHKNIAVEFQEKLSPEEFAEVFAVFIEQEIDLSGLENLEPVFTSDPGLAADGTLHLEGYFPSTPSRTHFSYTYVHREEGWKLLGLDVNIKPIKE